MCDKDGEQPAGCPILGQPNKVAQALARELGKCDPGRLIPVACAEKFERASRERQELLGLTKRILSNGEKVNGSITDLYNRASAVSERVTKVEVTSAGLEACKRTTSRRLWDLLKMAMQFAGAVFLAWLGLQRFGIHP